MSKDVMGPGEHDLNLLAAFVENRLDAAARARAAAHLASCVECRRTLAAYARASAAESEISTSPTSGAKWFRRPAGWLPAAAAIILATVVVAGVLKRGDAERSGPGAAEAPGIRSGTQAVPPRDASPDPSARRGGERVVSGKTFRLVAGEWIDHVYDPLTGLPEVEVRSAAERAALLQRIPVLGQFAALGPRVIVVHDGTVYKFGPDPLT